MANIMFEGSGDDEPVVGTPEGDGDFETDGLPDTGETSSGGQLDTSRKPAKNEVDRVKPSTLAKVVDEVRNRTLQL